MEDFRTGEERLIHFPGFQTGICAGLPSKAEVPVSGSVQRNKGKGGEHIRVRMDPAGLNSGFFQGADKQPAEGIAADFPDHGGTAPIL